MEMQIQLKDLHPDPDNLRESVDADAAAFKELVASIEGVGLLEPLIVRPRPEGGHWIVAGHRRHAAALVAGLKVADCVVRDITASEATEMQIIENLMRVDINPVEEASGYFRLVEMGMNRKALATRIGRSANHIGNRMRLLELPLKVQTAIKRGTITASDAQLMGGYEGEDLDGLIEVAKEHGNLKWRIEQLERRAGRADARETLIARAKDTTGFDPIVITRHEWTSGEYKSWRDLTEVCSEVEVEKHRLVCADIHHVLIIGDQSEWIEATSDMKVTKRELGLTTTLSDADLAEREAKRAERDHRAARMGAMQAACKGRLPVSPASLSDTVLWCYMHSVHQDVRKVAAQILDINAEDHADDSWFPMAALEAMLDQGGASANRVALALTMAESMGRFDRVESLDEELKSWGLLDG